MSGMAKPYQRAEGWQCGFLIDKDTGAPIQALAGASENSPAGTAG
jgi:hypothetical protein